MDITTIKNQYYTEQSNFFKVMSSPLRLQILQFISFAPRTVEDCALKFLQSFQNISLHLKTLQKAGILDVLKVKNYHFYYLAEGERRDLVFKALSIDSTTLIPAAHLCTQSFDQLMREVRNGDTAIIDLRSAEEIAYIPIDNVIVFQEEISILPSFLKRKSSFKKFVFICKGRMCERLAQAMQICIKENLPVEALVQSSNELMSFFRAK